MDLEAPVVLFAELDKNANFRAGQVKVVKVTKSARRQLKRILEERELEPGKCLRLATPPMWDQEGDFGVVIDDEGHADMAVAYKGQKVLLVDPVLAESLASAVFDYKDSPAGGRFTLDVY